MSNTHPPVITVWYLDRAGQLQPFRTHAPLQLASRRQGPPKPSGAGKWRWPVVQPVSPLRDAIGLVMVPERMSAGIWLNAMPLAAGAHLLRHADQLVVGERTYWISHQSTVEETRYDPAIHGQDVFCFLSKARLQAGQPIKICPGVPGSSCGVIYKAEAWDMAMRPDSPIKCPNCGYHPDQASWQPTIKQPGKKPDEYAAYLNTTAAGRHGRAIV